MRPTPSPVFRCALPVALACVVTLGCAEMSWDAARREDTIKAYHQFLRDNPGSSRKDDAQQRIAFLRVKNRPTTHGFEDFEETYEGSPMVWELAEVVEPLFFHDARHENTPAAYRAFLQRYPNGQLTHRAEGNLAYVERVQYRPTATELRSFLETYPESDFVAEARRTLQLLESRNNTTISSLAVRVDVSANVAETERVRRGFASVVARDYEGTGIHVSMVPPGEGIPATADAWMHIEYQEVPAPGTFGGRTFVSQARVRMFRRNEQAPVWDRRFEAPAEHLFKGAHSRDKTVFGNARYPFWSEFFVPISTWATSQARVRRISYEEVVESVDVQGNRAAVLLSDGSVHFLDVSTPLEPKLIHRHKRGRDLSRWTGVRVLAHERVITFGNNGAEIVEFDERATRRLGRWEAPEIGVIHGAALFGDGTALVAGSKGLFAVRFMEEPPVLHRLVDGNLVGVEVKGPLAYLVSRDQLDVATPKQLLSHVTGRKFALGDRLRAHRSRLSGDSLFLFGDTAVVQFSLEQPDQPVPVAQLNTRDLGPVSDMATDGRHLFLLGHRGIQVAGPGAKWVSDFIQVTGQAEMAAKGRFLLVGGGQAVEVVDLAPYTSAVASRAR